MVWKVPKMWEGGECWILGGGPSLPRQFGVPQEVIDAVLEGLASPSEYSPYMSEIHGRHVIGINAAYLLGDWIDMVFWGDKRFYLEHRQALADFPGLKVTCHPKLNVKTYRDDNIKYLIRDKGHPRGISRDPGRVGWNMNSGAAAISIAANAGAVRIVLVGFDMHMNGTGHWHSVYRKKGRTDPKKAPYSRHLRGFEQIAKDAKKRGIQILNACPESAIQELKKITVEKALQL